MKKSVVGVYATHHDTIEAVNVLLKNNLSKKDISIVGRVEELNGDLHIPTSENSEHATPVAIGGAIGVLTGILTGIGIFAIPGLGFIYGAGALIGGIAGFDFGLITGGMVSFAETLSETEHKHTLAEYLDKKYHLVIYTGSEKDKAEALIRKTDNIEVFH